jgi:hypothetical protein
MPERSPADPDHLRIDAGCALTYEKQDDSDQHRTVENDHLGRPVISS